MAKVIAMHLGVPWLMHVDRYYHTLKLTSTSRMRPDLIGPDVRRRWLVAEAKGRTGGSDPAALARMQLQKRSILRVGRSRPYHSIGSLAYFEDDCLSVRVIDPDDVERDSVEYPFEIDRFIWAYYQPFVQWFAGLEPTRAGQVTLRLAEIDANLTVSTELLAIAQRRDNYEDIADSVAAIASRPEDLEGRYGDGLRIELGAAWEPATRRLG